MHSRPTFSAEPDGRTDCSDGTQTTEVCDSSQSTLVNRFSPPALPPDTGLSAFARGKRSSGSGSERTRPMRDCSRNDTPRPSKAMDPTGSANSATSNI